SNQVADPCTSRCPWCEPCIDAATSSPAISRSDRRTPKMTKSRLEAFSDGVIAVIITIMVLEIKVPQGIDAMVLAPVVPVFLIYVLSFVFVGIYWNNPHHLFHAAHHVNGATLRATLHLLFWLALAPFVTGWAGTSHFATLPVPHTARSYSERPARTT